MYLYFKEELFRTVVRGSAVPVIAEIETLLAAFEGDSAELMRRVMLWWVHAGAKKDAGLIRVITAEANNFPELATVYRAEVIGRDMRLIANVLEHGIARKRVPASRPCPCHRSDHFGHAHVDYVDQRGSAIVSSRA
ncbi:hypothetical protein ACFPOU_23235 [Massilia jejuensis]|uniref:TetR family transcriptional regulator n=1 Tax=Massilia jejuensis TaxID=648894 RepID=A0ABW0PMZ7_9BURK